MKNDDIQLMNPELVTKDGEVYCVSCSGCKDPALCEYGGCYKFDCKEEKEGNEIDD